MTWIAHELERPRLSTVPDVHEALDPGELREEYIGYHRSVGIITFFPYLRVQTNLPGRRTHPFYLHLLLQNLRDFHPG